jgi:hypothetical protein
MLSEGEKREAHHYA